MTGDARPDIPARFRRQMRRAAMMRWGLGATLVGGLVVTLAANIPNRGWMVAGTAALVGLWLVLALQGIRQVHLARTSSALLADGRIEEARKGLLAALEGLSPLPSVKVLAGHYLAVAAHLSKRYAEAVAICRELLACRLGSMKSVAAATRLILADSLLMLDEVDSASPVIRDLKAGSLSVTDRLALLPIELRFQLATGHDAQATESLPKKVRLAELLDPSASALTHALLAEACRRTGLTHQRDYLLRRATLLADLEPLIDRYRPMLDSLDLAPPGPQPGETVDPHR